MERNFEKGIKEALNSLTSEKARRLEGLPMEIYKRYWHFMKPKIMAVVNELLENCFFKLEGQQYFHRPHASKRGREKSHQFATNPFIAQSIQNNRQSSSN